MITKVNIFVGKDTPAQFNVTTPSPGKFISLILYIYIYIYNITFYCQNC